VHSKKNNDAAVNVVNRVAMHYDSMSRVSVNLFTTVLSHTNDERVSQYYNNNINNNNNILII